MANLIITIISIALVAVAALMGAYYGGTAFLEAQSKANANTILNQGRQINAAIRTWWAYTNRTPASVPHWNVSSKPYTSTSLIPGYLNEIPILTIAMNDDNWDPWEIVYDYGGGLAWSAQSFSENQSGIVEIWGVAATYYPSPPSNTAQIAKICGNFNLISTGSSSISTLSDAITGGGTALTTIFGNYQSRCYYDNVLIGYVFVVRI